MTANLILKYEKIEQELQINQDDFENYGMIEDYSRIVFDIRPESNIEIKFLDDLERKVLTPQEMPKLMQKFSKNKKNYLYIYKKPFLPNSNNTKSTHMSLNIPSHDILSSNLKTPPQSCMMNFNIPSNHSTSFKSQSTTTIEEFKLEIQNSSNQVEKFQLFLKTSSNFNDLLEEIREHAELPNGEFLIRYNSQEDSGLKLNSKTFPAMMKYYLSIDKSKRILIAKEHQSNVSSCNSKDETTIYESLKSIRSVGSSTSSNSPCSTTAAAAVDKIGTMNGKSQLSTSTSVSCSKNSSLGNCDLKVIVEENLTYSQSSIEEVSVHVLTIKENDLLSDVTSRLSKKIKKIFTLKYFDKELESWICISDDNDLQDMKNSFNNMELKERKILAVISKHQTVNMSQFPSIKTKTQLSNNPKNTSDDDLLQSVTQSLQQKYSNITKIGNGAFSYVFKVTDNGKKKVIKVILNSQKSCDLSMLNDSLQEVMQVKSLQHPNIAHIETAQINNDPIYLYMVMEYYSKGDMTDLINQGNNQMLEVEVWRFIKQCAQALDYLKQKNIIHRDIKPDNFLQKDGNDGIIYVMTDFGLAKNVEKMKTKSKLSIAGTLGYLAPELLFSGEKSYSSASDMFAFGVTLFRLLSHNMRIDLSTISIEYQDESKLMEKIQKYIHERTRMYSKRLIELVTKMILYKPQDRITPEQVLKICNDTQKCQKCNKCKDSSCYTKGFTNCSCCNTICKECIEFYLEDAISNMNSKTVIKCMNCSALFTGSDIRKIVKPGTFETYSKIKNPPQTDTSYNHQQTSQFSPQSNSRPTYSNSNSSRIRHKNITCDACKQSDFTGIRWKCLNCFNYDLCNTCYQNRRNGHQSHKFARLEILDPNYEDDINAGNEKRLTGNLTGAISSFESAIRKYPLCEEALVLKADCEEKIGNNKTAKEYCEKVLNECNNHSVQANMLLGRIYLKHSQPRNAIPYFERGISIDQDSEICYYLLARAHQDVENYKLALFNARKAFSLKKEDEANLKLLSELLVQNEEWTEGKLVCTLFLIKDSTNAQALYHLGICEEKTGDYVESYKSYKAAAERNPFEIKYRIAADRLSKLVSLGILGALLN